MPNTMVRSLRCLTGLKQTVIFLSSVQPSFLLVFSTAAWGMMSLIRKVQCLLKRSCSKEQSSVFLFLSFIKLAQNDTSGTGSWASRLENYKLQTLFQLIMHTCNFVLVPQQFLCSSDYTNIPWRWPMHSASVIQGWPVCQGGNFLSSSPSPQSCPRCGSPNDNWAVKTPNRIHLLTPALREQQQQMQFAFYLYLLWRLGLIMQSCARVQLYKNLKKMLNWLIFKGQNTSQGQNVIFHSYCLTLSLPKDVYWWCNFLWRLALKGV